MPKVIGSAPAKYPGGSVSTPERRELAQKKYAEEQKRKKREMEEMEVENPQEFLSRKYDKSS
jgi:hypothetical protein